MYDSWKISLCPLSLCCFPLSLSLSQFPTSSCSLFVITWQCMMPSAFQDSHVSWVTWPRDSGTISSRAWPKLLTPVNKKRSCCPFPLHLEFLQWNSCYRLFWLRDMLCRNVQHHNWCVQCAAHQRPMARKSAFCLVLLNLSLFAGATFCSACSLGRFSSSGNTTNQTETEVTFLNVFNSLHNLFLIFLLFVKIAG